MRVHTLIITGLMAGVYSSILDGMEEDYGLHSFVSALIVTLLTILTGLLHHRHSNKGKNNIV
ncbi:hypothetical protein LCL96_07835 [Rossellomorea aquimaris]|uniref:hypothetical protein n=1 Tax=Rossellomorea TaxID=2837508 RepID=UPI001CD383BD|nr:hypothetical protein [Rossellomorea aquimaris]MCA1058840.1 hypothetical protein [Rossellomorea aquimaris]